VKVLLLDIESPVSERLMERFSELPDMEVKIQELPTGIRSTRRQSHVPT